MRRWISLLVAVLLAVSILFGCNKMPTVDKNIKPGEYLDNYDKLTELYGKPWKDVLKQLGVDQKDIKAESLNSVQIPIQENYAGLAFDISLRFTGDGATLRSVEYTTSYQYPEDENKLLKDLVKINRSLISDFGEASDTSYVFNWAEKKLGENWNRDIAYWQDAQILKRLFDNDYSGNLLLWNLRSVTPKNIKELGIEHALSVYVSILEEEGTAVITIAY